LTIKALTRPQTARYTRFNEEKARLNGFFLVTPGLLLYAELAVELINASACIDKLLLPRVKRMALRADFNLDVLPCAARFDYLTAGAPYCRLRVIGMNSLFH
jgi:hypothetical protein